MKMENNPKIYDIILNGQGLESIFEAQKGLMTKLIGEGSLPAYPIDLTQKKSQLFLRETLGYCIQELSEAYVEYQQVAELFLTNGEDKMMKGAIKKFNEEMADCFHFFVELAIYCKIDVDLIKSYFEEILKNENLHDAFYFEDDVLKGLISYGAHMTSKVLMKPEKREYRELFPANEDFELAAGRCVPLTKHYSEAFWLTTSAYYESINLLKKKPWRQTEKETDEDMFVEAMIKNFISLIALFELVGFNEKSLVVNYMNKNKTNLKRIEEKY